MRRFGRLAAMVLFVLSVGASASAEQRVHTVAKGQTLSGIAHRYGVATAELRRSNNISRGAIIRVGQKLVIPDASGAGRSGSHHSQSTSRTASDRHRHHVVAPGHTLGKIAKRYHVGIESICRANGIRRSDVLKPGQTLLIPNSDDDPIIDSPPGAQDDDSDDSGRSSGTLDATGMGTLDVPGAGPVYYFTPVGPGRLTMRPVLVYVHSRGGHPERDCRRWAHIARRYGWLVCPSGPVAHNDGRAWNNNWPSGRHAVMGAILALRKRYGRRVQLYGNTLIGFSEGAYVAMNIGVREPHTFNRWLILGADTSYWGGSGLEALKDARRRVRRVVLITGEHDQVVDDTREVASWLEHAKVPIRLQTPDSLAHELALERMPNLYESAIRWLNLADARPRSAKR